MKNKNKNNDSPKDDNKDRIRKAYDIIADDESPAENNENKHPGFLPVFIFIDGDCQDVRNLCMN